MSLSVEVYRHIRADIRDLVFQGNEFLNEESLAMRYGVSKAPVRQALHQLVVEGILISFPRKGYLIATVSHAELLRVQHLRLLNETYALELAFAAGPPYELEALRELAARPYTLAVNSAFHCGLTRLSGSQTLTDIVDRLLGATERSLALQNMVHMPSEHRTEHNRILEALESGDQERAKAALAEDLSLLVDDIR